MTKPSSCTPCNCIGGNVDKGYFMQAVQVILCAIADTVSTILSILQGGVPVTPQFSPAAIPAEGNLAFGAFSGGWIVLQTLTNTRGLDLYNYTDVEMVFSIDNSTEQIYLPPQTGKIINFGALGLYIPSATLYAQEDSTAPSTGSVRSSSYQS